MTERKTFEPVKKPIYYILLSKELDPIPVYDTPPEGWRYDKGALTAPKGYEWWNNGKRRFGGGNEHRAGLVLDKWNRK